MSETGRQSAPWLRPGLILPPLVLDAYSCHTQMDSCLPICLLHIKIFIPRTSYSYRLPLSSQQSDPQPHVVCSTVQFGFARGRQGLIGPATRLS